MRRRRVEKPKPHGPMVRTNTQAAPTRYFFRNCVLPRFCRRRILANHRPAPSLRSRRITSLSDLEFSKSVLLFPWNCIDDVVASTAFQMKNQHWTRFHFGVESVNLALLTFSGRTIGQPQARRAVWLVVRPVPTSVSSLTACSHNSGSSKPVAHPVHREFINSRPNRCLVKAATVLPPPCLR